MNNNVANISIPEKLYFTIGEVAKICQLKPHVLRYWEQEFPQLHPTKRKGNRRYYQRKDVLLIGVIKDLLYAQGYTIEGARQKLSSENGTKQNKNIPQPSIQQPRTSSQILQKTIEELESVVNILQAESV